MTLLDVSQQIFGNKGNSYSPAQIAATETNGADVLYGTAQLDADSGEVEVLIDGTEIPLDPDDPDYGLASTMTCATEELIQAGDRVTVVRNGQNAKAIVLSPDSTGAAAAQQAADDAAKVATNFLTMDEDTGLTVGASSLSRSVNINAGGVDIVGEEGLLAHYGSYTHIGAGSVGGITIEGDSGVSPSAWDGTTAHPYIAIFTSNGTIVDSHYLVCFPDSREMSPDYHSFIDDTSLTAYVVIQDASGQYFPQPLVLDLTGTTTTIARAVAQLGFCLIDVNTQDVGMSNIPSTMQTVVYVGTCGGVLTPHAQLTVQGDIYADSISSPAATASTLGVVKVGSGLSIAGDGTLSAVGITPADTSWAYLAGNSSSTNYCRWRCKAGWVIAEANYSSGASIPASGGNKTFGTIPSGYRPSKTVTVGATVSSNNVASMWVTNGGSVQGNQRSSSSSSTFFGSVTYPIG